MSKSDAKYPWEDSKLAKLIREKIDALAPTKTQREIAAEIGYDKPNILSMFKRGETKVPLERIPALARVLDIDVGLLFRLYLDQWWPGEEGVIAQMVEERVVTKNERALLKLIRTYLRADNSEISLDLLERLRRGFDDQKISS